MAVQVQCSACGAVYSVFEPTVGRRLRCPQCHELVQARPYSPGVRQVKATLARRVLDLAEQQGLLDPKSIAELRKKLEESKFVVTPEAIAKVLVDHGHLTAFQARKLVGQAVSAEEAEPAPTPKAAQAPAPQPQAPQPQQPRRDVPSSQRETIDLTFADDSDRQSSESAALTQDEIIDLEPAEEDEAPKTRLPAWKTNRAANPEPDPDDDIVPLEPVGDAEIAMAETLVNLEPIDDLVPLSTPAKPPSRAPVAPLQPQSSAFGGQSNDPLYIPLPSRNNVWDSPLLLVGGGVLGVTLVAFCVLLYLLTRGTAAEILSKAEADYRSGAYSAAIAGYDRFLKKYPDNPEASQARVRRGMAELRQVSDDGKNPRLALKTAEEILPKLESEKQFEDARIELASILPDIAEGLANLALRADEKKPKEDLLKLANQAMALVNNPSYVPATLRKERERKITGVVDKLKVVERSIEQDQELAKALEKIKTATGAGDVSAAYQARADLLRVYPALETNAAVEAAVREITEKERQLVSVSRPGTPAVTTETPSASEVLLLADRNGPSSTAAPARPALVLLEGAVYALDPATGRVLWRRFVGFETSAQPMSLSQDGPSDALVFSGQTQELMRLRGVSGQLAWRQEVGEMALGPALGGPNAVVTTPKGRVLKFDTTSGQLVGAAQLPQGARVAAAIDAQHAKLFQPGEHSTLFVFDLDSLACSETFYLGHKRGSILVPPVALFDRLIVCESPAENYSLLHVLAIDPQTKRLARVGTPFRLAGRIVTPLSVSGRLLAAATDLGQMAIYEVDAASPKEPLRQVGGTEAGEPSPVAPYYLLSGKRLWLANRRCSLFELQPAVEQLSRAWAIHQNETFINPLQLFEETLVHARRSDNGTVIVEGSGASDNHTLWTTQLAARIVALSANEARQNINALMSDGRLFSLSANDFRAGSRDRATFTTQSGTEGVLPDPAVSADGNVLCWTEARSGGRVVTFLASTGAAPTSTPLPGAGAEAAASAQLLASKLLVPLKNGSVSLIEPETGRQAVTPFSPPLMPSALPQWSRPELRPGGAGFWISDGRRSLYSILLKTDSPAKFVTEREIPLGGPLVSPLAFAGASAYGVVRLDEGSSLMAFEVEKATPPAKVALSGTVRAGPYAVGGAAILDAGAAGLICLDAGSKIRWTAAPADSQSSALAGTPLLAPGGDFLVIDQAGLVRRLDPATGQQIAAAHIKQPVSGAACILGQSLIVAGSDGVLHRLPLPQRP